jgi:hypothetical protein
MAAIELKPWQATLPPVLASSGEMRPHLCARDDYAYASLSAWHAAHRGRVPAQSCWRLAVLIRSGRSFPDALAVLRPERLWGPRPA